jgi:hypothetical protein
MEVELVSETLNHTNPLTKLSIRETFIEFWGRENVKTYICRPVVFKREYAKTGVRKIKKYIYKTSWAIIYSLLNTLILLFLIWNLFNIPFWT